MKKPSHAVICKALIDLTLGLNDELTAQPNDLAERRIRTETCVQILRDSEIAEPEARDQTAEIAVRSLGNVLRCQMRQDGSPHSKALYMKILTSLADEISEGFSERFVEKIQVQEKRYDAVAALITADDELVVPATDEDEMDGDFNEESIPKVTEG